MENKYETVAWTKNKLVGGIDEAGRGPLAGPLVVSGVILPVNFIHDQINDSKQLSLKKRLTLFPLIMQTALQVEIEVIPAQLIDELNIYQATKKAMTEIALKLASPLILTDAMPINLPGKSVISLIKGDQQSISIAAASIVAKVTRDYLMEYYHLLYPAYNFKQHKGYPTAEHLANLQTYSYCPIHRLSFRPVAQLSLFK